MTCGVAFVLLAPLAGRAADPEWKVGLAQVKITPERPVVMSGYAGRTKPFEKVATDLYVKAMVLEDPEGRRGVLVTSDLLGFPAAVAEPICERLQKKIGLKREQILLNSAHTHAGPALSLKMPAKDAPGAGEAVRTVEYTKELQDKVVEVVVKATERLQPARLSWGGGVVHFVMNRREFTPNGIILGVNPRGLADRSVPVLRVDGADGKPLAVLFGCACHNTTLGPDNYQISGDYAGYAQAHVQEKYPKVKAMFLLGCAGDANPYPRGTMDLARKHGVALGEEVCRVLETKLRPVRGPLGIAFAQVDLPLQTPPTRDELTKLAADRRSPRTWGAAPMLAALDRGEKLPTHYRCPQTVWQFGGDLTLVGLSGEVVVDYVSMLEKALGPNQLWVAGYCNDVFGYLPSARVLGEGGYETRGLYSGGAGFFAADAEKVLVKKVRELAGKAGRKLPAADEEVAELLKQVRAVGPRGDGAAAARAAWERLIARGPAVLPALLEAMDTADTVAANWLRTAFDCIVDDAAGKGLDADALLRFVKESKRQGRARRLALEVVEGLRPGTRKELLRDWVDDPEFRHDAITQALADLDRDKEMPADKRALELRRLFAATRDLAQSRVVAGQLRALKVSVSVADHFGFLRDWYVIGPFDARGMKGFRSVYPPEEKVDLAAVYDGKEKKIGWKRYRSPEATSGLHVALVNLREPLGDAEDAVAYAWTAFDVGAAREVEFRGAADDNLSVWVNGTRVFGFEEYRNGVRFDRHRFRVRLKAGVNTVLVKVCQAPSDPAHTEPNWEFLLRICDTEGKGLSFKGAMPEK
jgi:hypothetical protein